MIVFKHIRFLYRFVVAYIRRHLRFLFVSFIAGFFFFFFAYRVSSIVGQFVYPNTKRVGIIGRFTPETLPIPVQRLISGGLTDIAENGEAKPSLAKDWKLSSDGKTYTIYLQSGNLWHDGKEVTAYDVNYNIKDVTLTAENNTTLIVKLKEPFVPLPILLSRPLLRHGLIGFGPYKVSSLKLNADMVESIQLVPIGDNLPRLFLRFYATENQAKLAFKLGEIDILEDISDLGEFKNWPNVDKTRRVDHTRFIALFYNLHKPLLQDKSVRQALSFGIPDLDYEKATGPISPLSWAYSNKVRRYKFDLDAARRLLKKDIQEQASASSELTISTFAPHLILAKHIAESWQTLGFSVHVRIENVVPSDYQVLLAAQEIPPDPDQYPLWHSTQEETNITNLANPKIDKLLEDGRVTFDKEKRLKIYTDFQRYLVDEAPATFLYYPNVYTISRK